MVLHHIQVEFKRTYFISSGVYKKTVQIILLLQSAAESFYNAVIVF